MSRTQSSTKNAPPFHISVPVEPAEGQKRTWAPLGVGFYNEPTEQYPASVRLSLTRAPADGDIPHGLRTRRAFVFPANGSVPMSFADGQRLRMLTIRTYERDGKPASYRQDVGSAFYNAATDDRGEHFALLFDAIPLEPVVYLQPPRARPDEADDGEPAPAEGDELPPSFDDDIPF